MASTLLINCGLLLLFSICVDSHKSSISLANSEFSERFSFWPSVHNAARLLRHRRESQAADVPGFSEGVSEIKPSSTVETVVSQQVADSLVDNAQQIGTSNVQPEPAKPQSETPKAQNEIPKTQNETPKSDTTETQLDVHKTQPAVTLVSGNTTDQPTQPVNTTATNSTVVDKVKQLNITNPGVVKRGLIVFGGFALMAVAYLIFYRTKNKNSEANTTSIDANQFRYGVLQSEDKRDNELSRIPLTMESDDEDDEDLEIFDLEQKKKSLSYVNLQTDEDIVLSPRDSTLTNTTERENLLLDIDDGNSTLINWSSNNSKSIL